MGFAYLIAILYIFLIFVHVTRVRINFKTTCNTSSHAYGLSCGLFQALMLVPQSSIPSLSCTVILVVRSLLLSPVVKHWYRSTNEDNTENVFKLHSKQK